MKYDEVPESYHSSYMEQVAQKLSMLKMTPIEKVEYSHYCKKLYNDRDELFAARETGKEEGMTEGRNIEKIEIARKMRGLGLDTATIILTTGLTKEEIEGLE
jgi:predicted transposase/invertase (TIGR01784 family)